MNSWCQDLQQLKNVLVECFGDVGRPVESSRTKMDNFLAAYKNSMRDDEFYMLVDVRPRAIPIRWISNNVKRIIGGSSNTNMTGWFSLIHPSFLKLYLEYGKMAYKISVKHKESLIGKRTSYSIIIPIMNALDGKYWLFKQSCIPIEFDKNNRMVAHLNIYTRLNRFKKYTPSQPLIHFDSVSQNHLEAELIADMRNNVFKLFFSDLENRHKKLLIEYWRQYSGYLNGQGERPEAHFMSQKLNIQMTTIYKYNQEIIEYAREAFPITDFSDILSVLEFLHALFGAMEHSVSDKQAQ
ncbi:MAG: hypothetical protein AAGG68_03270 [Bacteroidota bacterium]